MTGLRVLVSKFAGLFRKGRLEERLDEEVLAHLDMLTEENLRKGMSREEARYAALRQFGNVGSMKEECRETWSIRFVEELVQDVRYGLRQLRRNPGFTIVAVLTLALGIGANTAIFSVVNGLVFRSLPVPDSGALVSFGFTCKGNPGIPTTSYPDLQDFRHQGGKWVDLFAYRMGMAGLNTGDRTDRIVVSYVMGNYFSGLRVRPALGRLILTSEGKPGRTNPVIVLGYSYWKSRFGGDPSIIGKSVHLNGNSVTVVGVAQKGFHGSLSFTNAQAFLPLNLAEVGIPWRNRADRNLFVLGRLRPGVTLSRANAAIQVIAGRLSQEHPRSDPGAKAWLLPQKEALLSPFPKPGQYQQEMAIFVFFLALALLVLLVACFNLASIILVRATVREREMAIRAALGAGRGRLMQQILTECFVLASLGCAAGILLGVWVSNLLQSIQISSGMPVSFDFSFGGRVFAYAAAVALLAGLVVGIVPAFWVWRSHPNHALHEGGHFVTRGGSRLRSLLVVAQVSGSVVLLVVAGLFTRGLIAAQHMDLGFNPRHLFKINMDVSEAGYDETQGRELFKNLLQRAQALPGVQSASLAYTYPSNGVVVDFRPVQAEGHPIPPGQAAPLIGLSSVSPDYFRTMQIPIVHGRPFLETDTESSAKVGIINETLAKELWPHEDPLGRRISISGAKGPWIQVVGIAQDSKYMVVFARKTPYFYLPLSQDYYPYETLLVRTVGPPETVMGTVESQARSLAASVPVFGVQTMNQTLNKSGTGFYSAHIGSDLTSALGLLGLILAVLGVYGVVSYSMSRRTHEIGIRIALGARRRDILMIAFREGIKLISVGVLVGLPIALGVSYLMAHAIYGVSPRDPLTYFGVTVLITTVALLACYIPARRAARVDPMVALRYE